MNTHTHTHTHTHACTLTHTLTHTLVHTHIHTPTPPHTHTLTHLQVNGKLLFEGILRLYWGLHQPIILAPGAAYSKQRNNVNRASIYDFVGVDDASYLMMLEEATRAQKRRTLFENERRRLVEISENSIQLSGSATLLGNARPILEGTPYVYPLGF